MGILRKSFPFCPQHDSMQCGAACLQMVCRWHGKRFTLERLSTDNSSQRSPEARRFISQAPPRLAFAGTFLVTAIVLALLLAMRFIHYPSAAGVEGNNATLWELVFGGR